MPQLGKGIWERHKEHLLKLILLTELRIPLGNHSPPTSTSSGGVNFTPFTPTPVINWHEIQGWNYGLGTSSRPNMKRWGPDSIFFAKSIKKKNDSFTRVAKIWGCKVKLQLYHQEEGAYLRMKPPQLRNKDKLLTLCTWTQTHWFIQAFQNCETIPLVI